jgi:GrpB-like predicted nucleotidyltransferase (UPF0157 family)
VSDAISLAAPDPNWPAAYILARDEILDLLPAPPLLIEHMGSTAVPGLMAKPVIDIIILVTDMEPTRQAMPRLARIGYEFRPAVSSPERLFLLRRDSNGVRSHHLHIHTDHSDVQRHLLFRDQLRADATMRRDYEALKLDLALRNADDREAYAKGKDALIDAVVQAAGGPARQSFWKA